MGYTRDAVKGISWTWALRFTTRALSFARIAIIARVLSPGLFGLYGIASLVLSFIEVFTEAGINVFIIQEKEDLKKIVNTAWVISIIRGFIIFILIILLSPLVALFFNSPDATFLVAIISIVPLIRGFINPSIIKFQKDLVFKTEFFFRGTIFFVESLMSVLFVVLLADPAGIIYGLIVGAVFEVMISFIFVSPRPILKLDKQKAKRIISRGKWVTAGGISNYLYHHVDDAIVGRVMGVASLGIYDMAYRISMLPITEIGQTISKVIFPVYTQISEDTKRLKRAFIRTLIGASAFSVPVGVMFFVFAQPLILLILGDGWLEAVPVFQALAIFGVIRTMLNPFYSLFLSVKKQEYNTTVATISFVAMFITIWPLINLYGLVGAAFSVVIGSLVAMPFAIYFMLRVFSANK